MSNQPRETAVENLLAATDSGANTAGEWRRGWRVVAGSMAGIGSGLYMFLTVFGFFVKPLSAEFGWTRAEIATSSFAIVAASVFMPVTGWLVDRGRIGNLLFCGAGAFALAYLSFPLMSGPLWQYYAIVALIALFGAPCTAPFVFARPVIRAFDKSRGLALGAIMCGVPLLALCGLPLLSHIIATHGWRSGFMCMLPLSIGFGALSWWLMGRGERARGEQPGSPVTVLQTGLNLREVFADPRFWLLMLAMLGTSFSIGLYLSSLQPLLSDKGVDATTAGFLGAWQAIMVVASRLIFGTVIDRFWAPLVGAIGFAAPSLGLLILYGVGSHAIVLALGIALIAAADGAEASLMSYLTSHYFGSRTFGVVNGFLGGAGSIAVAAAGLLAGLCFDRNGNYNMILLAGMTLSPIAALSTLISGFLKRKAR
jgi:MFS family permease